MSCDCCNSCSNSNCSSSPCAATCANTAACESLPSQLENFITQFFGTITKTEVNGVVSWTLPCNLNVGLPANPRAEDEGLACYFLRLFGEGIIGLKGDPGTPGASGSPGANSFTVTLHSFTQPTVGSPNLTLVTAYNPAILTGEYVFVQNSGWYLVNSTDGAGTLFLTLVSALPGASGTITAGKLVVPTGPPGVSVIGPQGLQGPTGDTGPAAPSYTATHGFFFDASGGTDFPLPNVSAIVDFVNNTAAVLLPVAGTYLVTAITNWEYDSGAQNIADVITFKLVNTTTVADVPGSTQSRVDTVTSPNGQLVLQAQLTTIGANQTIALYGSTSSAATINVPFDRTNISYVRLS